MNWTPLWIVAVGSALGGAARYQIGAWIVTRFDVAPHWGTLAVNISGCCIIGILAALFADSGRMPAADSLRLLLFTGMLGGYTTFSTFSLDTLELWRVASPAAALLHVCLSLGGCLLAVVAGYSAVLAIAGLRAAH